MPTTPYTPPTTAILHHTTAYFDSRPPAAPVHIVQYDFTLPIVAVALYANGEPHTVPEGGTVSIRMGKPDGTIVYNPALGLDAARSTAYIAITPQMTIFAGDFEPVLEVSTDTGVAGTSKFALIIDPNPVPEDKIKSTDEYKTVQHLAALAAASAAAAAESEQKAAASEAAADASALTASSAETSATSSATAAAFSASQAATDAATATQKAAAAAASAQAAQEAAEQAQQVAQGALGYYVDVDALRTAHPTGTAGEWAIVGSTDSIWVWDVEGGAWKDSGQSMDLSDYYNKTQTDALIAPVQASATAAQTTAEATAADVQIFACTLLADGWTALPAEGGGNETAESGGEAGGGEAVAAQADGETGGGETTTPAVAVYTQTVACPGLLAAYDLEAPQVPTTGVQATDAALKEGLDALCEAGNSGETLDGQLSWTCYGSHPTVDLPLRLRRAAAKSAPDAGGEPETPAGPGGEEVQPNENL